MMALLLCLRALVLSLQLCCSINVRLYCFRPLLCTWLTNAPFFPHTFSFRYGKVSQCFNMKNHVYMPDDFGFGHMKHCVAINTTSWLDQSLDILLTPAFEHSTTRCIKFNLSTSLLPKQLSTLSAWWSKLTSATPWRTLASQENGSTSSG